MFDSDVLSIASTLATLQKDLVTYQELCRSELQFTIMVAAASACALTAFVARRMSFMSSGLLVASSLRWMLEAVGGLRCLVWSIVQLTFARQAAASVGALKQADQNDEIELKRELAFRVDSEGAVTAAGAAPAVEPPLSENEDPWQQCKDVCPPEPEAAAPLQRDEMEFEEAQEVLVKSPKELEQVRKCRGNCHILGCSDTQLVSDQEGAITVKDLDLLINRLGDEDYDTSLQGGWEQIVEKRTSSVSYSAKRRDPQDGRPTEYKSTTAFEDTTVEAVRDFFMDSDFLLGWDNLVKSYRQVAFCPDSGVEVGVFLKKYPLCSPREYVLGWKVWKGAGGEWYCITKAVEHLDVPRKPKLSKVEMYRSG
eukprot:TRINITY_DN4333_c0_g1_i4.p1 TRINITY_DN4333_c0_g1~~TRINITY_DN4333_c0_g1_i4.p1  ORF type:complete len:367 (-),score=74.64 TRINITY_DN4333_c0_g1_i4:307-1407(-)